MKIWPEKIVLPFIAFGLEAVFSRAQILPEWAVIPFFYALLFWFVATNLKQGAWAYLFGAGTLMNFVVISANGFQMPVSAFLFSEDAYRPVYDALVNHEIFGYVLEDAKTRIIVLGDIIAVAPFHKLLGFASIGDLFLLAGVVILAIRIFDLKIGQK